MNSPNLTTVLLPPATRRSIGDDSRRPASRSMPRRPGTASKLGKIRGPQMGRIHRPLRRRRRHRREGGGDLHAGSSRRSEDEGRSAVEVACVIGTSQRPVSGIRGAIINQYVELDVSQKETAAGVVGRMRAPRVGPTRSATLINGIGQLRRTGGGPAHVSSSRAPPSARPPHRTNRGD